MVDNLLVNRLLAGLPRTEFDAIARQGVVVDIRRGTVICDVGEEADQVYFPLAGTASLLAVLENGKGIETASVGTDGVLAAMAGLGFHVSQVRIVAQSQMSALRISATAFRKLIATSRLIADLSVRYNEILLNQARTIVTCNTVHTVEARFCRWLLFVNDRLGPSQMALTQEYIADVLGVRRTSISEVAGRLALAGILSYTRGVITINDRARLLALSCECYATMKRLAPP